MCTLKSLKDRQTPLGWVLRVLSILSELTDQTIPVAMIMFLLIKPAGSLIEDLRDSKIPWACTMQAYIWGGGGGEGVGEKEGTKCLQTKQDIYLIHKDGP